MINSFVNVIQYVLILYLWLQTYCGTPKRTILLRGIQDVLDEEDLQDHLEIHFQKPSNYGGEVESIKYVSGSSKELKAFFSEDLGVEA